MGHTISIADLKALALARGGECLSDTYLGVTKTLLWKCAHEHVWRAKPTNIIHSNTWCPTCAGRGRYSPEVVLQSATRHGGLCLTPLRPFKVLDKLEWECREGHRFFATAQAVVSRGSWCRTCGYEIVSKKLSGHIDRLRNIAAERGGLCLSSEYPRRGQKAQWQCADGHIFMMTPSAAKNAGQWCPTCATGVSERLCRALFEAIFSADFPKGRPKWLISPEGTLMELDGYNATLRLAFEYQGEQHYRSISRDKSDQALRRRQDYDRAKRQLCAASGVNLIEVPYTLKAAEMQSFITQKALHFNIDVAVTQHVPLASLEYYPRRRLEEMHELAKARGGECLAERYVNVTEKVRWRCSKGHEWEASLPLHKEQEAVVSKVQSKEEVDLRRFVPTRRSARRCLSRDRVQEHQRPYQVALFGRA